MFDLLDGFWWGMPMADIPEVTIPLLAVGLIFGIPIIAILTTHQRKMAELIRRSQPQQVDPMIQQQLSSMQSQISDMRSMMQDHIINNDRPSTPNSVEQRLNS